MAEKWEASTSAIEARTRRVVIRTAMILGPDGGALVRLVRPFRFFVGGHVGTGEQWTSWIHIEDVIQGILFFIENKDQWGVFNLTAPCPLKNKDFSRAIGDVIGRPSWLPVPGFFLKVLFGQMAEEALLSSQRVFPMRLERSGYKFIFPEVKSALADIFGTTS